MKKLDQRWYWKFEKRGSYGSSNDARRTGVELAVFTGSGIILVIAWFTVPWLGVSSGGQLFGVGFLWLVLMLAFEIAFGRWVFRVSWQRIAAEFDFRKGGLLSIGMAVLLFAPLLVEWMRGSI